MGTVGDNFLLRFINTLFKQFGHNSLVWGELVVPSEVPSRFGLLSPHGLFSWESRFEVRP